MDGVVIPAGGHAVFFADSPEDDRTLPNLNFGIAAGDEIFLSYRGRVIDSLTVPEMDFGQVYARAVDGTGEFQVMSPTPGTSNNRAYYVAAPSFSKSSGFFDDPLYLTISSAPGHRIYYTLDSSVPTTESTRFTQPLSITDASVNENVFSAITNIVSADFPPYIPPDFLVDKATIVRAVAVDEFGNTSAVATASYFVGFEDREGFQDVRILSLVVDPNDLRRFFPSSLYMERGVSLRNAQLYQVFINGEYWGAYNAMERFNEEFIEVNYGVSRENLLLMGDGAVRVGPAGRGSWVDFVGFVESRDLSDMENYERVLQMMDIQSFIDWITAVFYNADIDTTLTGNVYFWRSIETSDESEFADGRWRWMEFDNNASAARNNYNWNPFNDMAAWHNIPFMQQPFIQSLLENASFREQFVLTFMDMANYNFNSERVSAMLDEVYAEYSAPMAVDQMRWGREYFSQTIDNVRHFFDNRFDYATGHLAENLELTGRLVTLTIATSNEQAGDITLNTITPGLTDGHWSGQYFTDFPVSVTASPRPGYRFVRWETGGAEAFEPLTDRTIQIKLTGNHTITAVFELAVSN